MGRPRLVLGAVADLAWIVCGLGVFRCMAARTMKKPAVESARQLFLYGAGDGKRVLSTQALAVAVGVHEQTIRAHMGSWQKEAEELISNTSENGLALALSKATLEDHKKDLLHLRNDVDSIKFEMNSLDDVIETLSGICENFSLNSDNGDKALSLFDRYIKASLNKSHLRGQFLAAEKRWAAASGIEAVADISVTAAKAMSVGKAKLELKKLENEEGPRDANRMSSGVFARPAKLEIEED